MEVRKPFQGVANIISFNRHFYIAGLIVIAGAVSLQVFHDALLYFAIASGVVIVWSLVVSAYVYDFSGLYDFPTVKSDGIEERVINITAGFDETTGILQDRFAHSDFKVYNFYDPVKNTEISIERAVRKYPAYPGTIKVDPTQLPSKSGTADKIFLIFAAHEIRSQTDRIAFFRELHRILKDDGQISIIEHLRDLPNFLAYNIGFLHFYPQSVWDEVFKTSGFEIYQVGKPNIFVTHYIIKKNGASF